MDWLVDRNRDRILAIAKKHGAFAVRVFGSRGRGMASPESDLDLLVEMEPGRSLLDLVGLGQDLEKLLGIKVDLTTPAALSPYLRDDVEREAVPL